MPTLPHIENTSQLDIPEHVSVEPLKRIAFLLGRQAVFGDESAADKLLARIQDMPQEHREVLLESFDAGMRRGRDPTAPNKAAEVVKAYIGLYGEVKTREKLGKSRSYPRLLLMAYALGKDGKPFMFPVSRLSSVLRINNATIENFISMSIRNGYLYLVRHGIKGTNGSPAWYRLNLHVVRNELGLDGIYFSFDNRISLMMA